MTRPRVVVTGRVGMPTLTDDLHLAGLLRVLRAVEISVVVMADDPEHVARTHGAAAIPADVPSLVAAAIKSADLVAFAGGRVLSDVEGPACLTRHLGRVCLAKAAGATVVPFGIRVDELTSRLSTALCRRVLPMMSSGLLQDSRSADLFQQLGGPESSVGPDLMFALQPPLVRSEDRIVVCLRPVGGPDEEPFIAAMAASLQRASVQSGLPLRFLSLRAGRDDRLHRQVAERIVGPATSHVVADLVNVLPELGQARMVVSMHQAGVVGAVLGGRPCVGVDHRGEVARIVDELGGRVAARVAATPEGLGNLPEVVAGLLGRDADVIDVREEQRARLIRARSVIERTLYAV